MALTDHEWPAPGEHLWDRWRTREHSPKARTQYRSCLHPDCDAFEIRDTPRVG